MKVKMTFKISKKEIREFAKVVTEIEKMSVFNQFINNRHQNRNRNNHNNRFNKDK